MRFYRQAASITRYYREFALSQPDGQGEPKSRPGLPPLTRKDGEPGWAAGLRKLYNSVVDEPLPDSFDDILMKLDKSDDD
jgi:hypothetical protein